MEITNQINRCRCELCGVPVMYVTKNVFGN